MGVIGRQPAPAPIRAGDIGVGVIADASIIGLSAGKLLGQVPDVNAPEGSVIQVVHYVDSTTQTYLNVSANAAYTHVSGAITPRSSTSRIVVLTSVQTWWQNSAGATTLYGKINILRNGTVIHAGAAAENVIGAISEFGFRHALTLIDSPNSTSSVTYSTQYVHDAPSPITSLTLNRNQSPARLTLMEIAA